MIESSAAMWFTALITLICLIVITIGTAIGGVLLKRMWVSMLAYVFGIASTLTVWFLMWTFICNVIVYLKT